MSDDKSDITTNSITYEAKWENFIIKPGFHVPFDIIGIDMYECILHQRNANDELTSIFHKGFFIGFSQGIKVVS